MFLSDTKRNQNSWNTYQMQKDDTVMHYTRVNVKSLVRCSKYCIILLPFQLKTKRKNQHCCTYWLTKKRLKQNQKNYPDCIMEQCLDVPLKFGIHQFSTVWYSTALKFEIFPSVWRCFSIDIVL